MPVCSHATKMLMKPNYHLTLQRVILIVCAKQLLNITTEIREWRPHKKTYVLVAAVAVVVAVC